MCRDRKFKFAIFLHTVNKNRYGALLVDVTCGGRRTTVMYRIGYVLFPTVQFDCCFPLVYSTIPQCVECVTISERENSPFSFEIPIRIERKREEFFRSKK